ncbi:MAG: phosphate regulon sensor histidine kinase PhoR [Zoogloeaceae bacterium]|jgi:two-component system phosphate regulon sensor histidine kinase PhoR|nr:phosphate regulon sensor histidine kinase PhoR [Zoogloeaceae bacterium]
MSFLFSRLFILLACMGSGMALAVSFGQAGHTVAGVAAGALAWLVWDGWRAARFAAWLYRLQDDPTAAPPRFFGTRKEVAERIQRLLRQQARAMAESENRLRDLQSALQASPNGVVILNERECIEWCNRMACEHFGLDARRDLAQRVTNLLRDPALVACLAARDFDEAIALTSPASTSAHPLRLAVRIFPYGEGRLFLLSQDITVLEQAEAMRRDFVANVSHEIRTPLTVLAGFVETLQTLPLGENERRDYLARMARQTARMKNLVGDLLALSRLEGSPQPGLEEHVSVRALLERCEADARALSAHLHGESAHSFVFTGMDEADEIAGVAGELQSAFFNLVNNAIRYTPPGGRIRVGWKAGETGDGRFFVQDSGPGIAPEHIPRLTERFYRIDPDRSRESGGTGLGLSIVKHILQRHDAALQIDSLPGQGACFTAIFPEFRISREKRVSGQT